MNWLLNHVNEITSIIGYASIAANFLPTKTKTIVGAGLRIISVAVNAVALDFKSTSAAAQNKSVVVTSKPKGTLND